MLKYLLLVLILFLTSDYLFSQKDSIDVTTKKPILVKTIFPATLFLTGAIISGKQVEKDWQIDIRNRVGNDYRTYVDDYIQYAPYLQIYLGDMIGVHSPFSALRAWLAI